jgi:glycosyltransferase involved in cell wall biosynthesis
MTGVPWCVSIHAEYDKLFELDSEYGAPRMFGSRWLAKKVERFVLSRAPMVLPIRESLGEYAVRNGADPQKIRIIPHGIQMEPFLRPPDPRFPDKIKLPGRRFVVFAGRLSKENYVGDILEIAKRVAGCRSDVVFLVLGDGKERQAMEEEVRQAGLQGIVHFFGFIPREELATFRINADVNLCLTGGFSLIEAAAAGKPVIAYDVMWHYELVRNDETGFLLPEHDVDGACRAILTLLEDRALADRLGNGARQLAVERHSLEGVRQAKIQCYDALIQSSRLSGCMILSVPFSRSPQ